MGGIGVIRIDGTDHHRLTDPDLSREIHDVSPAWQAIPPPARADFKNAAQFCKAEREH
jgi:hypothetical protein